MTDNNTPCELRLYDPDYDDRRGGSHHEGYYRTRSAAQAKADEYNEAELGRLNARRTSEHNAKYNAAVRNVTEHNALFEAGLRPERLPDPVRSEAVLLTIEDLTEGEFQLWAHDKEPRRRWPKSHHFVSEIDFDG